MSFRKEEELIKLLSIRRVNSVLVRSDLKILSI